MRDTPARATRLRRTPRPVPRPKRARYIPASEIAARVEVLYVGFVSFALGAVGMALGVVLGVLPYFRTTDVRQFDWFFIACMGGGALLGFAFGVANGGRWYRTDDAPAPLAQRRMLAYLRQRGADARISATRTIAAGGSRPVAGPARHNLD